MIPIASLAAKSLGKRIRKVTVQQMDRFGVLNSYLIEIFKKTLGKNYKWNGRASKTISVKL